MVNKTSFNFRIRIQKAGDAASDPNCGRFCGDLPQIAEVILRLAGTYFKKADRVKAPVDCRGSELFAKLSELIQANILAAAQIAPYAPLEIKRADLDSEPVFGILMRLKATGKLILEGDALADQQSLFTENQ